jgi:hypothetical protein
MDRPTKEALLMGGAGFTLVAIALWWLGYLDRFIRAWNP